MLVVNGACEQKDWQWVASHASAFDVTVENVSQQINLLAVQGPQSLATLQPLTSAGFGWAGVLQLCRRPLGRRADDHLAHWLYGRAWLRTLLPRR